MSAEEPSDVAPKLGVCNREIVRRGALILFCDYVVSVRTQAVEVGGWGAPHVRDTLQTG